MELKWIVVTIVLLIICSFPVLFNIFGKEDGCGRSMFDKWKIKKNKNNK